MIRIFFIIINLTILNTFSAYGQPLSQVSPKNNTVLSKNIVNFKWNHTYNNSVVFEVEVSTDANFTSTFFTATSNTNSLEATLPYGEYWWRVKQGAMMSSSNFYFEVFSPIQLSNKLYAWHDFDSIIGTGNAIDTLLDISMNNNFCFQNISVFRKPIFIKDSVLNNNNLAHFDGDDYLNSLSTIQSINGFYAFFLAKNISSDNNVARYIYDQGNAANNGSGLAISNEKYYIYSPLSSGGERITKDNISKINEYNVLTQAIDFNDSISMFINGLVDSSLNLSLNSFNSNIQSNLPLRIGMTSKNIDYTRTFIGEIAEIIFIKDTLLTPNTTKLISKYLMTKHCPPVNLGTDIVREYSLCDLTHLKPKNYNKYKSYLWSTGDTTNQIPFSNGTFWVKVIDVFGNESSDTINISGLVRPTINIDTMFCVLDTPSILHPINQAENFNLLWQNGSTDSTYQIHNSENINLIISDFNGCSVNINKYIQIDSFSVNYSLGVDTSVCSNSPLTLKSLVDVSIPNNISYLWSTNDTTPSIVLSSTGSYSVEAENSNSCVLKDTVNITVKGLTPNVNFSGDTTCLGNPTNFTDLSSTLAPDNINSWIWDFGTGDTSYSQNPIFLFSTVGNFSVELSVQTDSGCVNQITKNVHIKESPQANFDFGIHCAQVAAQIQDASTINSPNSISQWIWTFDNGSSNLQNPEVTFNSEGIKTIDLLVTATNGCTDSITKTVEIYPALLPNFKVSNICVGDSIQFIDITPSFSTIEKEWRFGVLNETSSAESPKFLYPNAGNYDVKLTLTNAIGCTNSIIKTIEIHDLPQASATYENICIDNLALFVDASTVNNGFVNEMTWFIDGNSFSHDSLQYVFDTLINQEVAHNITDNFGCFDDTTFQVQINDLPDVDFSFTPNYGTAPLNVSFNSQSNSAVIYSWDFGDGIGTSSDENPNYTYTENGFYNITLTSTNQFACSNSIFKQLVVTPTDLDLDLSNVTFTEVILADGSVAYKPSVLLKNVGTRHITNADLYASVNNETKVAETWMGSLGIGQALLYEFTSFFVIQNDKLLDYICVSGNNVNDNTESNLSNNKVCEIQKGVLQSSPIYPNPTNNMAYMDVISKNKGILNVDIYDMLGKKVFSYENINIEKGYNQITINCATLQAGPYYINQTYLGEMYTQKLVITNQ